MNDNDDWDGPKSLWQCFWYGRKGEWFYGRHERNEYLEMYVMEFYDHKKYRMVAWRMLYLLWGIEEFFEQVQSVRKGELHKGNWEDTWTLREFLFLRLVEIPASRIFRFVKYRVLCMTYHDPHIACYSYPNCDEAPMGCSVRMGDDVEQYGHRD